MEFVENKEFNEYISEFKKMDLLAKKNITINEINKLLIFLERINTDLNCSGNILFNREILDMKKENPTEDDFVEAIFVYINSIEELIANYVDNIENKKGGNNG